jgi:hypothetical protein
VAGSVLTFGGRAGAVDRFNRWAWTVVSRMQGRERDRGAGFVEYAGLMIIVAGIFVLIKGLNLGGLISGAIRTAVTSVTG